MLTTALGTTVGGPVTDNVAKSLSSQVMVGCLCLAALGALSANPLESMLAALVPAILFQLLWRTGETPILLFCAMLQWLQASAAIFGSNLEGVSLDYSFSGPELRYAAWLSLIGIVVLAVGINVALRSQPRIQQQLLDRWTLQLDPNRLLFSYFALWFLSTLFEYVLLRMPGLKSTSASIVLLKWIPLYLLAARTFVLRKGYRLLLIPVGIEIAMGITGYFSSFKSVLFLMLIISIGTLVRTPRVPWRRIAVIVVPIVLLVGIWQGVKTEHRRFISGGTHQQVVVVSFRERASNLLRLVGALNVGSLIDAFNSSVNRVSYLEYFAYSIRNVPSKIPHERGALWVGAVNHVFLPRVIFPNKPIIDDSERTNKYTLRGVAGMRYGTQISIGYMGESYIDFGMFGMFIPIFLLGVSYGKIQQWFIQRAPNPLLGLAFATALLLLTASLLEMSNIKIVGGVVAGFIIFSVVLRFAGSAVWAWLCKAP